MLTKNGRALLVINNNVSRPTSGKWRKNDGNYDFFSSGSSVSIMCSSMKLYVGTGTSEVKSSDYAMTNRNAGLTLLNRTGTNGDRQINPDNDFIGIFTATYKNDTNADISVSEVGLCSEAENWYVLMAREVLDAPIVIAPGETYTFSMYIG